MFEIVFMVLKHSNEVLLSLTLTLIRYFCSLQLPFDNLFLCPLRLKRQLLDTNWVLIWVIPEASEVKWVSLRLPELTLNSHQCLSHPADASYFQQETNQTCNRKTWHCDIALFFLTTHCRTRTPIKLDNYCFKVVNFHRNVAIITY